MFDGEISKKIQAKKHVQNQLLQKVLKVQNLWIRNAFIEHLSCTKNYSVNWRSAASATKKPIVTPKITFYLTFPDFLIINLQVTSFLASIKVSVIKDI